MHTSRQPAFTGLDTSITAEMGTINRLWQDNYAEVRRVLRLSVPVSIGLLLNRMITFLSVIFVGHLGPAELAAASLGSSLLNILGLAVMAGLAGAITTLSGQVSSAACSQATAHAIRLCFNHSPRKTNARLLVLCAVNWLTAQCASKPTLHVVQD